MRRDKISPITSLINLFPNIFYGDETSQPILDIWNNYRVQAFPQGLEFYAYDLYSVTEYDTIYSISYKFYGDVGYWWLILLINDIDDPYTFLDDVVSDTENYNSQIKLLKSEYIPTILRRIKIFKGIADSKNERLGNV